MKEENLVIRPVNVGFLYTEVVNESPEWEITVSKNESFLSISVSEVNSIFGCLEFKYCKNLGICDSDQNIKNVSST